jgi:hypothetical protein
MYMDRDRVVGIDPGLCTAHFSWIDLTNLDRPEEVGHHIVGLGKGATKIPKEFVYPRIREAAYNASRKGDVPFIEGFAMSAKFGLAREAEACAFMCEGVYNKTGLWPIPVPPSSAKVFLSGRGKAGKDLMLKNVLKVLGVDTDSEHHADALCIAFVGWAILGGEEVERPDYRRKALKTIWEGLRKKDMNIVERLSGWRALLGSRKE